MRINYLTQKELTYSTLASSQKIQTSKTQYNETTKVDYSKLSAGI